MRKMRCTSGRRIYKATWGDEPNVGGLYGSEFAWLKASKEQVEREAAKQEVASKL
jgi:hypothetical protein